MYRNRYQEDRNTQSSVNVLTYVTNEDQVLLYFSADPRTVYLIFSKFRNIMTSWTHWVKVGGLLHFQFSRMRWRAIRDAKAMAFWQGIEGFAPLTVTPKIAVRGLGLIVCFLLLRESEKPGFRNWTEIDKTKTYDRGRQGRTDTGDTLDQH